MAQPPSPPYIPAKYHGGHQSTIKRIVLHSTVSNTYRGAARAIAKYFQNPSYQSSAHYTVDPGEVIQCVYDHTIAWHDGTNSNSIGIEMCEQPNQDVGRWDRGEHPALLAQTAGLVRQLCLAYGIPMRKLTPAQIRAGEKGICSHADMRDAFPGSTSHWDPGAFPWDRFISLVNNGSGVSAAPGGIEAMAFNDTYKDWAGNTQSVQSWMNHVDQRLWQLANLMFTPGSEPSRIPGDKNKTNGRDALMDTTAKAAITYAMVQDLHRKVDGLEMGGIDVDSVSDKIIEKLGPQIADAVANKLAERLAE